jgi:anti-anti-sigma factor
VEFDNPIRGTKVDVTESRSGDVLIFTLRGQLDGFTAKGVEQQVLQHVDKGQRSVVIDLSGVDYISSVGLGALVMIHRRLKGFNGRMCLCQVREPVQEILETSALTKLFEIREKGEEAVASLTAT